MEDFKMIFYKENGKWGVSRWDTKEYGKVPPHYDRIEKFHITEQDAYKDYVRKKKKAKKEKVFYERKKFYLKSL